MSPAAVGELEGYEPSDEDLDWMLSEHERFEALSPDEQAAEMDEAEGRWLSMEEAIAKERYYYGAPLDTVAVPHRRAASAGT